jgi:hypothetical protein
MKVEVVTIGPCQCPGTPHEQDEATVRWDLGASALARIGRAELDRNRLRDPMAAWRQLVLEAVASWNLLLPNDDGVGVPAPIIPDVVAELDDDTLTTLATAIDNLIDSSGTLPNASGAPSVASSPESASPTRKRTPKPGT